MKYPSPGEGWGEWVCVPAPRARRLTVAGVAAALSAEILRRLLVGVVAVYVVILSACGSTSGSLGVPTSHGDLAASCPRLDSQLFQLTKSADPASFALGAGLELSSSGVRVVIELGAGADLPAGHGVRAEARYSNSVQGQVPVAELCPLAQEPAVLSVAPPARRAAESARP